MKQEVAYLKDDLDVSKVKATDPFLCMPVPVPDFFILLLAWSTARISDFPFASA